eukprot:480553-Prorocentrum_minimum.AAC.1
MCHTVCGPPDAPPVAALQTCHTVLMGHHSWVCGVCVCGAGLSYSGDVHMGHHSGCVVCVALWVYSHDGPIIRRKHGYILTTDQSYAGDTGLFSRRTNHTQEARVYSHDGPIICRKRGYILVTDQSDAGSA